MAFRYSWKCHCIFLFYLFFFLFYYYFDQKWNENVEKYFKQLGKQVIVCCPKRMVNTYYFKTLTKEESIVNVNDKPKNQSRQVVPHQDWILMHIQCKLHTLFCKNSFGCTSICSYMSLFKMTALRLLWTICELFFFFCSLFFSLFIIFLPFCDSILFLFVKKEKKNSHTTCAKVRIAKLKRNRREERRKKKQIVVMRTLTGNS